MKTISTEKDTLSDDNTYINQMTKLTKTIKDMRSMASTLIPYTYPKADFKDEQDVLCLKQRTITVDGYEVILCYSDAEYKEYVLSSLQIQPVQGPFLPFTLICKLGKEFFGYKNVSYIEFFRNNNKVYCWTIKSREGRRLFPGKKTKPSSYEGYKFRILHPGSVDLF